MIKNLFEVSREEKNRILRLHETATKKQYLIFEQNENPDPEIFGPVNLGQHFEYGKHESATVKSDIQNLKPKIEEFISANTAYSKFEVKIEGGESQVTNPEGFEQQGSLALARANSVKKYFEEIFPEQIKSGVLVINAPTEVSQVEIGTTPYGGKGSGDHLNKDKKALYEEEQFVRFQIKGIGEKKIENKNPAGCGQRFNAAENQGFGDFNNDFTKTVDFTLTVESGEITIQTEAWKMPDILYISIDGKTDFTNNTGYFQGLDAAYTRIFLGTALRAKYGTSLPDMLSSRGYTITVPDQQTLINNAEDLVGWGLSSLNNIYGPGAPLQNDQWWKNITDFDKNIRQNVQKRMRILLRALGSEFPWGYLNGVIQRGQGDSNLRNIGPIKIDSPGKPQTLQVVNCAPNGKTQWSMYVTCKS